VNTVTFTEDGARCLTGSDDHDVRIWSAETAEPVACHASGHQDNVFQARQMPHRPTKCVTCSADGSVRAMDLETGATRGLADHHGRCHRLTVVPGCGNTILSCAEDGRVFLCDLRTPAAPVTVLREFPLYCIAMSPALPHLFVVGGAHSGALVYDIRRPDTHAAEFSPRHLRESSDHITGLVSAHSPLPMLCLLTSSTPQSFDYRGDRLVSTYNDEDIYTFALSEHSKVDGDDSDDPTYLRRFTGHVNYQTVKAVSFFGDRSEHVVSGSDGGHLFVWDAATAELENIFVGDSVGAINCLEPHPFLPYLATSGLSHTAKLWRPVRDCAEQSDVSEAGDEGWMMPAEIASAVMDDNRITREVRKDAMRRSRVFTQQRQGGEADEYMITRLAGATGMEMSSIADLLEAVRSGVSPADLSIEPDGLMFQVYSVLVSYVMRSESGGQWASDDGDGGDGDDDDSDDGSASGGGRDESDDDDSEGGGGESDDGGGGGIR